jgi:hypothetical protein
MKDNFNILPDKLYQKLIKGIENNEHYVIGEMIGIGMDFVLDDKVWSLIIKCTESKDEWIRRAGVICLYHNYISARDNICDARFFSFIEKCQNDQSIEVQDILDELKSELVEFSPSLYYQYFPR